MRCLASLARGVRQTSFALPLRSSQGGGGAILARLENPAAFAVAEEAKEKEAVATAVTEPPSLPSSQGASIYELGAALEEQT